MTHFFLINLDFLIIVITHGCNLPVAYKNLFISQNAFLKKEVKPTTL